MDRDKDAALHLIKESILQQRYESFRAVSLHPLVVAWWTVLNAATWKICAHLGHDPMTTVIVAMMLSIGLICGIYNACRTYSIFANNIGTGWIRPDDIIIGARTRDDLISTAVLRLENFPARNKRRKTNGKALIMAWTTKKESRKKGMGKQVLEEAVRIAKEKAGNGVEIGFAAEHANSQFPLPALFIRSFRRNERMAARVLLDILNGRGLDLRGARRWGVTKKTRTF